jgi:hypothetical protein
MSLSIQDGFNLLFDISIFFLNNSIPMNFVFNFDATRAVVPLPRKGSSIIPFSGQHAFMAISTSFLGYAA